MFNKLRNRFLIVNMVIITFIMLVAFAAIYTITYQNVRHDIDMELNQVSEFFHKPDGGNRGGDQRFDGNGKQPKQGLMDKPMDARYPPAERSVSFSLFADEQWNITATDSRFDMDDEFYRSAIAEASASSSPKGQFTLDGNRWAFLVQNFADGGHSVVFLDVTAQQTILKNLVYTFLIVGLAMLILIFFVSRYFAARSIAPVKEAFDKQKQFIGDASHELKTPLAVINTNADVLLANSSDTIADQSKWLHLIKSETERMKTLTNDLLYLTEMDDAREGVLHTDMNVSEAVESVILTMEAVMFEKELDLQYEIEPGLTAHGNSEQMKQVVMILLDNAAKYTNARGSVSVTLKKAHHGTELIVSNTGAGIQPEHLGRLFDRFYRVDTSRSRKHGGYGLGLAIAKSIVEQHRGKIFARSVPNETTSFHVQLP
ncbi:sensor histidine kinase [Paenibacillus kobensis]|uniref:sensor histidine kinase n=1 Tax=Paenibacillus kobensis TaxID=59841 RepID=UPI000FDB3165|nr:HAMP domain-containing sensor histidine kinase [Paenibacillus kobensis]